MTPETIPPSSTAGTAIMRYAPLAVAAIALRECDPRLVFLHQPDGPAAEQYRRVAARIQSRFSLGGTLMVTSPAPGDGKTLSAMNLAFCLAERGPVLLIDFDTRSGSIREKLRLAPPAAGIEDVLLGKASPEDCVMSIPGTGLCVAINRGQRHRVVDLMGEGRPRQLLDWALKRFRWVILDTPPAFPVADTLEIAQYAGVGLLVVRSRKTPARLTRLAVETLKGNLHFVMFNDSEAPSYSAYESKYYLK